MPPGKLFAEDADRLASGRQVRGYGGAVGGSSTVPPEQIADLAVRGDAWPVARFIGGDTRAAPALLTACMWWPLPMSVSAASPPVKWP